MDISKKIAFATEDDETTTVISGLRSDPGVSVDTGTLCGTEIANTTCYIYSETTPIVSSGDIVYNTNNQTSPFNGGSDYYKLNNGANSYIVTIDAVGVVAVIDLCI
jgi:hypothetical protein